MTVEEWLGKDNTLGIDIWEKKYRYNGESFDKWLDRVSGGDEELREYIKDKKFMFGGRITANRGTNKNATMMNCYSRGFVGDSLAEIMKANTDIAMTFKAQGGQGLSLSKIRPKGTGINNGQFKSDGIIPFMEIFNKTTESVSQGGSRKGALLMSLDAWHKEAKDFITIKSDQNKIQKANLSLEIDDEFMEDVEKYYKTGDVVKKHIVRDYGGNRVEYDVCPIEVYKLMMQQAWESGEPGVLLLGRFRNYNLMEYCNDYNIECCNPCGEQPLAKNAACDLGSINLAKFVINEFEPDARFDFESFGKVIDCGVRSLDLIIDENEKNHALEEQRLQSKNYRNIGLGVMGLYDCLVEMNMTYGSQESIRFIDSLFGYMFRRAVIASSKLASEKGTFPNYSDNVLRSKIIRKHFSEDDLNILGIRKNGLRNCSLLSIAPTGSIGTMFNIGTGCEPAFMLSFKRKTESLKGKDEYYTVYMDVAQRYKDSHKGSELPDTFVTSQNINWKDRINVQAAIQEHVDTGISSTVNLPNKITVEEVEQLYLYAWKKELKGVTIFRDGCKRAGILTTGDKKEDDNKVTMQDIPRGVIIKADDNCIGKKRTLHTGCGSLHIQAFFDPDTGDLLETFFSRGSSGGCTNSYTGLSRMISLSARAGVDIYSIVDQLKSSGVCPSYAVRGATKHDTSRGSSCPVAIGNALLEMYNEVKEDIGIDEPVQKKAVKIESTPRTKKLFKNDQDAIDNGCCPQCGSALIRTGGCINCIDCGWTKCD